VRYGQVDELALELGSCTSDFVGIELASANLRYYVATKTYKANGLVSATQTMADHWGTNIARKQSPREAFSRVR